MSEQAVFEQAQSEYGDKDPAAMANRLAACFRKYRETDVQIHNLHALSGGASAETWRFEYTTAEASDTCIAAIFRCSSIQQASQFSTSVAKQTEAAAQRLCGRFQVPVPEILFCVAPEDHLGEGYVMSCVEGETIPRRILRNPDLAGVRENLARQCGEVLGRIHQVPLNEVQDHLEDQSPLKQLDSLETLYLSYQQPSPVFEVAFRWLREQAPPEEPLTLVHGDFRNGNLVIDDTGIAAVLDWELCHLGNPIEDLGWLCVNAWCFGSDLPVGGFGSIDTLLEAYAEQTGRRVSREELRYWQVFGTLRWGIICLFQANCYTSGLNPSLELAAIGRRVSETEIDILNLLS